VLDTGGSSVGLRPVAAPGVPLRPWARSSRADAARRGGAGWTRQYVAALVGLETLASTLAGVVVLEARDGGTSATPVLNVASWALIPLWPLLLAVSGAYTQRVIGAGSDEFRRVGHAGLLTLSLFSFVSYAAKAELSRAFVVFGIPGLVLVTLLVRVAARSVLRELRRRGACLKRVVVVGRGGAVLSLVDRLQTQRPAGLQVVASCVTETDRVRVAEITGLPVAGLDGVLAMARSVGADTIAVTSSSETAAQYLRELSWELEGSGLELLVAPGLIEVAGPRLHIRPFEGLPLLSVEEPHFEGWRRVVKGGVDRLAAAAALVLLAPVLLGIALAVRLDSPGPVLYRQERVGLNGQPFTMLKFRSMVVDAEARLAAIQSENIGDGVLFKMREDPRVTRVGRVLRRLSLDELPQLVNVLNGTMSLVGPRPPLPREVAQYEPSVSRRLLVKPGLTGLWQISGRSDLSWEESVRLDLRYVENWSLALDLSILRKTVSAVLASRGAY
jgi:exopolysaccharide biosynthesis polyprenyl glycosylphosphotransferase